MRKYLVLVLVMLMLLVGTSAYAAGTLRTFHQPGYDVDIEYYANTEDMFFYLLHDKSNNLIAVGLDNEGCFVYGEWDHETGGVKQALNEDGEECVVGVHPAPASSKMYPIPDIAYAAREKRVAEFEAYNQPIEQVEEPIVGGISYQEYMAMKKQASSLSSATEPRDKWNGTFPLHPVLPIKRDAYTGTNFKSQKAIVLFITFEGDVDHLGRPLIFTDETRTTPISTIDPSYLNDMMFSSTEWRPYIDYRHLDNPANADPFSYTYIANSSETDRAAILTSVFGTVNPPATLETNQTAFANGIFHGSVAHFLYYGSKERNTIDPALDLNGKGAVVTVVLSRDWAQPYDTGNVGQTIGKPNGPNNNSAANGRLRSESIRKLAEQIDLRQIPGAVYSVANNRWTVPVGALSIASVLTGYAYELSAERNVLNEFVGVWGNSASNIPVASADLPAFYEGASVVVGGIYQMTSHMIDESRADNTRDNPNNASVPRLRGVWPTRPRQFVVYAHEYSHNALGAHDIPGKTGANIHSDVYDTSAQSRNQSNATLWPIFFRGDYLDANDRIVILSRDQDLVDSDAARNDTRNWFPGTRYSAAFGNWGIQGVGGYMGADAEDVAARGGNHEGWNWVDRNRIILPRILRETTQNVKLEYGDIIRIEVAKPRNASGFFDTYYGTPTDIDNQTFYLAVRENAGYDKGVFDWARTHLVALSNDTTYEGNKAGNERYSIREGGLTAADLTAMGIGADETAFRHARGGLLISHVDVLYQQSSGITNNAPRATYGLPLITVEAHAYPSGIYTNGTEHPTNYGTGEFVGKYPDINRVTMSHANKLENGILSRDSFPETQHLLERYMVDRARGEYVSWDVRFNMADPADIFNQWGVNEFVNPRLYSGDSRVIFGTGGASAILAGSADIIKAMDRQRHPTGPVAPFAVRNIKYYDKATPGYEDTDGRGYPYVTFDFEVTMSADDVTVSLNSTGLTLPIGETETLTAGVVPETYPGDRTIIWSSNNPAVASVSETGEVTAASVGFAMVKAALASNPDIYAECLVTVPIQPASLTITPVSSSLRIGGSVNLTANVLPEVAGIKTVTWSSSNEDVAVVSATSDTGAVVNALTAGTATITATTVDGGETATCEITVQTDVAGVTLNKSTTTLIVGRTETLTATVTPTTASERGVTWSSNNTDVATVSNGVVTGKSGGVATITVTTVEGNFSAACDVVVTVPVSGVSLTPTTVSLKIGGTVTTSLQAAVAPADATNKGISWRSNNTAVVAVTGSGTSATVTANSAGTATITVRTADGGIEANSVVTVSPADVVTPPPPPVIDEPTRITAPNIFGDTPPAGAIYGAAGQLIFETVEGLDEWIILLSDSQLDGWTMVSRTPVQEAGVWETTLSNGELAVMFLQEASGSVDVLLTSASDEVGRILTVNFSGKAASGGGGGCSAGFGFLAIAILGAVPFVLRKKK